MNTGKSVSADRSGTGKYINMLTELLWKARAPVVLSGLVLLAFLSLFVGPVRLPLDSVTSILLKQLPFLGPNLDPTYTPAQYEIVLFIQEPAVIAAIIVGATLAVGGVSVQGIFRNPITEPYIIGISSGAALGAVMTLSSTFLSNDAGIFSLQVNAFLFSLIVVYVTYFTSFRRGSVPVTYLLLTGIAISIFVSSIVAFIIYTNIRLQSEVFFWLMGSLQNVGWIDIILVGGVSAACLLLIMFLAPELDAIQMGEDYASSLGVRVELYKITLLSLVALSVSACVSITGLIGFVGLIIPHIARMLFGGSGRKMIPWAAILGALFLLVANDLANTIDGEVVIPIGIITGIIGVPFFMALMYKLSTGGYNA